MRRQNEVGEMAPERAANIQDLDGGTAVSRRRAMTIVGAVAPSPVSGGPPFIHLMYVGGAASALDFGVNCYPPFTRRTINARKFSGISATPTGRCTWFGRRSRPPMRAGIRSP